ncbi:MAG: hypothetical protein GXP31_05390 [Kiritimatiellaeota bacterium]|nr:hypothetical protein [Kiritimatiellota bacterium]
MKNTDYNGNPRQGRRFALSFIVVAGIVAAEAGGAPAPKPDGPITGLANDDVFVHKVTLLKEGGQSVSWAPNPKRILLSRRSVDRYYRVFVLSSDGIGRCLTLGMQGGRLHRANASWYPTGEYVVFTAQNPGSPYKPALPGMGLNSNIWLTDAGGNSFWQLTHIVTSFTRPKGTVLPYFSPDGRRLFWAGNTGQWDAEKHAWGERALYLADFKFDDKGVPHLSNQRKFQPGERRDFYESHGFSPDGTLLLFSANPGKDQSVYGMDICVLDPQSKKMTNLTDTPDIWDEYAAFSPDGRKIVWASNASQNVQVPTFGVRDWKRFLRSEVWIMDRNGSHPRQLTHFNTRGFPEYIGRRSFIGGLAWAPDNRRLAVIVNTDSPPTIKAKTFLVELGAGPPTEQNEGTKRGGKKSKPPVPGKKGADGKRLPGRPVLPLRY